jgi:threonine dehydratase
VTQDSARQLLARYIDRTPLTVSASLSTPERTVHLKNETVLPTGSFKVRGALYALFRRVAREQVHEVVAASTGNHGAAVAYAARLLKVAARIFLPSGSNPVKAARVRDLGAALVESGEDLSAAIDAARDYASHSGAYFLHDASDPDIPAGTATIGEEILEQLPTVNAVFVPMGDTALIRGVAAALRTAPEPIRVVGVVAERAPAYFQSWQSGDVVETTSALTIADGLAVRRPLKPNVDAIRALVDEVVTVTEQEMLDTIALLRRKEQLLAEPSGVAALAALLRNRERTGHCVALVTGGNISPDILRQLPSTSGIEGRRQS